MSQDLFARVGRAPIQNLRIQEAHYNDLRLDVGYHNKKLVYDQRDRPYFTGGEAYVDDTDEGGRMFWEIAEFYETYKNDIYPDYNEDDDFPMASSRLKLSLGGYDENIFTAILELNGNLEHRYQRQKIAFPYPFLTCDPKTRKISLPNNIVWRSGYKVQATYFRDWIATQFTASNYPDWDYINMDITTNADYEFYPKLVVPNTASSAKMQSFNRIGFRYVSRDTDPPAIDHYLIKLDDDIIFDGGIPNQEHLTTDPNISFNGEYIYYNLNKSFIHNYYKKRLYVKCTRDKNVTERSGKVGIANYFTMTEDQRLLGHYRQMDFVKMDITIRK